MQVRDELTRQLKVLGIKVSKPVFYQLYMYVLDFGLTKYSLEPCTISRMIQFVLYHGKISER